MIGNYITEERKTDPSSLSSILVSRHRVHKRSTSQSESIRLGHRSVRIEVEVLAIATAIVENRPLGNTGNYKC